MPVASRASSPAPFGYPTQYVTGQIHLVPQQANVCRSVCRLASLAVLTDWCELENGVAVCLGDEIFYR